MKNKQTIAAFAVIALAASSLASCQIAPINATTTITSAEGAGTKTISALMLVDGSCQIEPDTTSFPTNANYYYIEDPEFDNITITPKADGAKVKVYKDGYLTNPNKLTSCQAVWDEFNDVVKSYVPEGFTFNLKEAHSTDWQASYMETVPDATVSAWKAYIYQITYSWTNIDEYISKTKTLVGKSYDSSHLAEIEQDGKKWASMSKNEDGTYTFKEAYLVNYWSVFDIFNNVMNSDYYNRVALGEAYKVATDSAFAVALQQYKIGESDPVLVKVDNKNGTNSDLSAKYIQATGTIPEVKNNLGLIIGCVVGGVVVVGAGIGIGIALKKKKAAK